MPSDKVHGKQTTQTGSMPRINMEPVLRREAPPMEMPEIIDTENGSTTGEMPTILIAPDDKTQDEDTPAGR